MQPASKAVQKCKTYKRLKNSICRFVRLIVACKPEEVTRVLPLPVSMLAVWWTS